MPQLKVRIGCVVLAVIMSAVTYYFVEPRLRWGRYGGYKAAGLLSVMVAVGIAGYSVERHDGYTVRMNDPKQVVIDAINRQLKADNTRCLKLFPEWDTSESKQHVILQCKFQKSSEKNTIAIIGDSYAGHLYPGLTAQINKNDGLILFPAACAVPLVGVNSGKNSTPLREHLISKGFEYILSHKNINKVILSHSPICSWQNAVDTYNPGNRDYYSIMHDGFVRTYDILTKAGKKIYVVKSNPGFTSEIAATCKASVGRRPVPIPAFLYSKGTDACSEKWSEVVDKEAVDNWNKIAHEAAVGYKNIHFIDLERPFCSNGYCSMLDSKGRFLYMDTGHLNINGSIYVASSIIEQLEKNNYYDHSEVSSMVSLP